MNTNTYDSQTARFAATVLTSMSEKHKIITPTFKTWRTLKLGTGLKDVEDFRRALKKADCDIGEWGNDILGKPAFTVSPEKTEVELVKVSVAELGLKDGATRADIYKRANELGLNICPNEVGPQLCLQYKDHSNSEWLIVAMEPIVASDDHPLVFTVEWDDNGKQWLGGYDGRPGYFWHAGNCWVFIRRK